MSNLTRWMMAAALLISASNLFAEVWQSDFVPFASVSSAYQRMTLTIEGDDLEIYIEDYMNSPDLGLRDFFTTRLKLRIESRELEAGFGRTYLNFHGENRGILFAGHTPGVIQSLNKVSGVFEPQTVCGLPWNIGIENDVSGRKNCPINGADVFIEFTRLGGEVTYTFTYKNDTNELYFDPFDFWKHPLVFNQKVPLKRLH